jgi:DNA-binding transcriptional regulator YhcF (GntR family)
VARQRKAASKKQDSELKANGGRRRLEEKWSKPVIDTGYTVIPNVLLQAQRRLGLDVLNLNLLLQITKHWWTAGENPYPGRAHLAEVMTVHPRTVQRRLREPEQAGFLRHVERHGVDGRQMTNEYDLGGLVEKLQPFAKEILQAKDQAKRAGRPRRKRGPSRSKVGRGDSR